MRLLSMIEPNLEGLEAEYRSHFLERDVRSASIGLIFLIFAFSVMGYNDYGIFGISEQFWLLLLCRSICVAGLVTMICLINRTDSVTTCDRVLLTGIVMGFICLAYIDSTRPPLMYPRILWDMLAILGAYLFYPNYLIFRAAPPFLFSIGTVLMELYKDQPPDSSWLNSMILAMCAANVMGIVVSTSWNRMRRGVFKAAVDGRQIEKKLAQALETAEQLRIEAQEANKAKSAFLANMSHELRTPLNAILGFSQLTAQRKGLQDDVRENISIINRSGRHLLKHINSVLEMSKVEAGIDTLTIQPFDVLSMLEDMESLIRIRADQKRLDLAFERDVNVPRHIISDESKITQILMNILGNAVKYTDEGAVTVHVSTERDGALSDKENGKTCLQIEISDTGIGIPADKIETIFTPFARLKTHGRVEEGTGLGLAITKKNIDLLGGSLRVESTFGAGTKFSIHINVGVVGPNGIESVNGPPPVIGIEPGSSAPDGACFRILLVDDQKENRLWLNRLISRAGFEVMEADNGQEALDLNERFKPHLIWMDIRMPVMDGKEAATRIRSKGALGNQPVIIALSASVFKEEEAECIASGCDDFVQKPASIDVIFKKMSEHLEVRYVYDETNEHTDTIPGKRSVDELAQEIGLLSPVRMRELEESLEEGDVSKVREAVKKIGSENPRLAESLEIYARDFAYGELLDAVRQARETVMEDRYAKRK